MNLVFSLLILFGVALIYYYTGQTMIAKGLMLLNFKPNFSCILILLGLIGKCGLFPANLSNICIVDGISLFSSYQALVSIKLCFQIILGFNVLCFLENV